MSTDFLLMTNPRRLMEPIPNLPIDKPLMYQQCFINGSQCKNKVATDIILRYYKENEKKIDGILNDKSDPPAIVNGIEFAKAYANLDILLSDIEHKYKKKKIGDNCKIAEIKGIATKIDELLGELKKPKITGRKPAITYQIDDESVTNIIVRNENRLWAYFLCDFMKDLLRACIIYNDNESTKECNIQLPFIDSINSSRNSKNIQNICELFNSISEDIKQYIDSKNIDSKGVLTDGMKNFLKESGKIINFLIDNFFDENQKQYSIDINKDTDLELLANILFSYKLDGEFVNDYLKSKSSSERENFLYLVLNMMRLLQQVYISVVVIYYKFIIRGFCFNHISTFGFGDKKYIYNKQSKKFIFITPMFIKFTETRFNHFIGYSVLQTSFENILAGFSRNMLFFFDFLPNQNTFFQDLDIFFRLSVSEKINGIIDKLPNSEEIIEPRNYNKLLSDITSSLSQNNSLLTRLFNIGEKLRQMIELIKNNNINIKVKIDNKYTKKGFFNSVKYFNNNDFKISSTNSNSEVFFHIPLSYDYKLPLESQIKINEKSRENFFNLLKLFYEELKSEEQYGLIDFILIIDIETVLSYLKTKLIFDEQQKSFIISLVYDINQNNYKIYLGNNNDIEIPGLLDDILGIIPDLFKSLNKSNLFIILTDTSIENKRLDSKGYLNILGVLERFDSFASYSHSIISNSCLVNKMVRIMVQNGLGETYNNKNEIINMFAKMLLMLFIKSSQMIDDIFDLEEISQLFIWFGLYLLQNPIYFPPFKEIFGDKVISRISHIGTQFEKEKKILYKYLNFDDYSTYTEDKLKELEDFKHRYVNNFVTQRLYDYILLQERQKEVDIMESSAMAFQPFAAAAPPVYGGNRKVITKSKVKKYNKNKSTNPKKTKKNKKLIKSFQTMKKNIKLKNNKTNKNKTKKNKTNKK